MLKALAFVATLSVVAVSTAVSKTLPPNPCPDYFQYENNGRSFYGIISLQNLTMEAIETITFVEAEFIQKSLEAASCTIRFRQNKNTFLRNVKEGKPVSFYISFPTKDEVPALRSIKVNGVNTLCLARNNENVIDSEQLVINLIMGFVRTGNSLVEIDDLFNWGEIKGKGCTISNYTDIRFRNGFTESVKENKALLEINEICGKERKGLPELKGSGEKLVRGQFPWLAVIAQRTTAGPLTIGSGNLISTRLVVSAASLFKRDQLKTVVYLGRYNLDDYEESGYIVKHIDKFYIHPDFRQGTPADADIALLHMQSPVKFSDNIQPICLWNEDDGINKIVGESGYIAGWGNKKQLSPVPKVIEAKIAEADTCLRVQYEYTLQATTRTFCAGNRDGSGPCMGDSGIGLLMRRSDRWTLRGIVTTKQAQEDDCFLHQYVLYVDVAQHKSWIQTHFV